jgi:hypothetical protein
VTRPSMAGWSRSVTLPTLTFTPSPYRAPETNHCMLRGPAGAWATVTNLMSKPRVPATAG